MAKKVMLILLAISMFALVGCRGNRTVKVYVDCDTAWSGTLTLDNGAINDSGTSSAVYDEGNTTSNITISAQKTAAATASSTLTLRIVEHYDQGFLYDESTATKAEATTSSNQTIITAAYDFSQK